MSRPTASAIALLAFSFSLQAQGPAPAPAGLVTGVGNFTHIVENMDRSLAFYRDALGLEPNNIRPDFSSNPGITKMLGAPATVQSKVSTLKIPGSAMGVELIEYKGVEHKAAHPHFYDPGAANLALRVRDVDAIFERLKKIDTKVLTKAGGPTMVNNTKVVFVQDPDGFVVEIGQAQPGAKTTAPEGSNIIGAAFEATIGDTEKTVAFYRDGAGYPITAGASFNGNQLMAETAGAPGASFRQSRSSIPGTSFPMTFIEFKNIERKPLHTHITDPGTALIQLRVRDADEAAMKLAAAGGTIVSEGGHAAEIAPGRKIALVRDPNNLFLELVGAPPEK